MYGAGLLALWRRARARRAGRTYRDYTGSLEAGFTEVRVATETPKLRLPSTLSSGPWGGAGHSSGRHETQGGSLGSEGRLDDALDGVTVTEIRTKRAVLEDGVDEQPGSD